MCGFIAQLVEHRTGIAEVTGSNPIEALIFFQAFSFQLLTVMIIPHFHIVLSLCIACLYRSYHRPAMRTNSYSYLAHIVFSTPTAWTIDLQSVQRVTATHLTVPLCKHCKPVLLVL